MARTKRVTSNEILDAVERVVMKLGVSRLSIDAVAREAGISKSRVVYDYKSKNALLEALIDRQFQRDMERNRALVEECAGTPHPELFARLRSGENVPDDVEKAVAMAITASMSSEQSVRQKMKAWFGYDLAAMESGAKPLAARLAYFAMLGFGCPEWFGLVEWSESDRLSFVRDIRTMYACCPDEPALSPPVQTKGSKQS